VIYPLFWLGLSIFFVTASLTAVLVVAIPALQELARAARSAEKFFDTLSRELPPTLDAIRKTGLEITDLTDDLNEGVKSVGQVVKQVDQSLDGAKKQAQNFQVGARSIGVGVKAAWKSFTRQKSGRRTTDHLPTSEKQPLNLREREALRQENRWTQPDTFGTNDDYSETTNWEPDFDEDDFVSKSTSRDDWSEQ
jgi:ABC-type transporter Mla subunit MlaD